MSAQRVLHVITRLDSGGSAVSTFIGAAGIGPGFETALAVGGGETGFREMARRFGDKGLRVLPVPHLTREVSPLRDAAALLELYRLMRSFKPDIVHTHTSKAGVLGRVAARLYAKASGQAPKVVHTPHGHVFYGYFSDSKSRFYLSVERFCAKLTDRLVALSEGEKRESLERGVGRPEQWAVVHSGVELPVISYDEEKRRALRESVGIPAEAVVAGFVGRLTPVKGLDILLRAAELLKGRRELFFLLVGDGESRAALEAQAAALKLGNVRFAGFSEDVFPWLQAMDIFVHPSLNEGMGRSLVEAQWAGLPVAATTVCGIPDVVLDGATGLLVPPSNHVSLSQALGLLASSRELRRSFGGKGRQWVSSPDENGLPRFSAQAMSRKLEALYSGL